MGERALYAHNKVVREITTATEKRRRRVSELLLMAIHSFGRRPVSSDDLSLGSDLPSHTHTHTRDTHTRDTHTHFVVRTNAARPANEPDLFCWESESLAVYASQLATHLTQPDIDHHISRKREGISPTTHIQNTPAPYHTPYTSITSHNKQALHHTALYVGFYVLRIAKDQTSQLHPSIHPPMQA